MLHFEYPYLVASPYILVYGTLRQGHANNAMMHPAVYQGTYRLRKFTLLKSQHGMCFATPSKNKNDSIVVELYKYDFNNPDIPGRIRLLELADLNAKLDLYEQVASTLYTIFIIPIELSNSEIVYAKMYVNMHASGEIITNGDFFGVETNVPFLKISE